MSFFFRVHALFWVALAVLMLPFVISPAAAQRYEVQEAGLDGGGGVATSGDLVVTSSLETSPVGTVRTDRYVLYSGMPSPFTGRAAIMIIHDPSGTAEGGQAQDLTARIVTNDAPLQSATLYYRVGADAEPTSVSMTPADSGFVATIPSSDVGTEGFTYYFVATDEQGTSVRAPRRGVYSLPVRLAEPGPRKPGPQPGGTTQSAYRLLSMPIELENPNPEAVLGDDISSLASTSAYDPTVARLFEPIGTRMAEFPGTGDFALGQAFWLIVRQEVDSIDAGAGTVRALNAPVEISLDQGWNFVGTPFTVPVPVEKLEMANEDSVTLRSYGSDGYNTPDNPVTEMEPFSGYAVFAESATTLTVNPPLPDTDSSQAAIRAASSKQSPFPWHLRIRGTSETGWDADNVAAVHPEATDGWDQARDWAEPPSLGNGLRIAFDPPEGAPTEMSLSADVRRLPTRGTAWPLTVHTEAAGPVRLSVEGVSQVPGTFEVWLVDLSTKTTWNLRRTSQARLDVLSEGAERPMRLVVGTKAYVQEQLRDLEALPQEYVLRPPYPNPSAGRVAFQVGLPEEERVTLEVYNVLGQRVAVVKDGASMPSGFHTVVWDAPRLASGMYFLRMEAGDYRKTRKLVRVR